MRVCVAVGSCERAADTLLRFKCAVAWEMLGVWISWLEGNGKQITASLSHSLSPSPKASVDPSMLCWSWQDFLTDEQKEQLCLLLWLCSLLVLLLVQRVSCHSPGGGVTLFAASKDVRTTHPSALPHPQPQNKHC